MAKRMLCKGLAALRLLAIVAIATGALSVAQLAAQAPAAQAPAEKAPADKAPAEKTPAEKALAREDLQRAMAKIETGMSAETVRKILGEPDVILDRESGGLIPEVSKEIWYVGCGDADSEPPCLGHIYFDKDGKVQGAFGRATKPLSKDAIPGADLPALLKVLGELPSQIGGSYDQGVVIRAVNALEPLGKERALGVIQESMRTDRRPRDEREGLFLLLRVLFEVPADPGYAPVMELGRFEPGPPKDPKLTPRFPIVIQDGIPFLLTEGRLGFGIAQEPEAHFVYYRQKGVLRKDLLAPTSKPIDAFHRLMRSPQWNFHIPGDPLYSDDSRGRAIILDQLTRLLGSVYRPQRADPLDIDEKAQQEKEFAAIAAIKCRWDDAKGEYVAAP
jgi:hypothetical protein